MRSNVVGLMTKFAEPGRVKKRLALTVGDKAAYDIYCALLDNTLDRSQPEYSSSYSFGAFVQPSSRLEEFSQQCEADHPLDYCMGQPPGDLGEKMLYAFGQLLGWPEVKRVILIGADIPDLGRKQIEAGFSALEERDVVFGPTDDGGYYLIGMKRARPELFEGINWGTSQVMEQSQEIADRSGFSYELLEPLADLDNADDLRRFPQFSIGNGKVE